MKKKILAVLMAVVFVMSSIPLLASDLRDLQNQLDEALADVQGQQEELAATREAINRINEELRVLDDRLNSATFDLHNISIALDATTTALEQAELDIAAAQEEIDRQYDIIMRRLRDMQMQGTMGLLSVLFQATSLRDFLFRLEYVNNVARADQEMVARLESSEARLILLQESYARQYSMVGDLQLRQQAYIDYLESMEEERIAYFEALLEDEYNAAALLAFYQEQAEYIEAVWREAYQAEQRRLEEERRARQRRIEEEQRIAIANLSGMFRWPVPSSASISSPFGPRRHPITGRQETHSGIDIRAAHGAEIQAADDGVVILSGRNGGFGITVIIDHGDGIHTLYAHNSRNLVSVGDRVTRGQAIALVGSTGVSTGPHLHFEVRVGGRWVDPGPFLGL